jgi:UDP-N-acetylmuramoylalanine--D-glutamate ligase
VLLNCTPDHLDRHGSMQDYLRAKARIFMNQSPFDWAIVQSDLLRTMRSNGLKIPSKVITFSASDQTADLWLERGLLISRLDNWAGPLLDLEQTKLRGPHNAENLMAALAVGHVLRIPLDQMVDAVKSYSPGPHRCQFVAEIQSVQFVNDSKATNLDAMIKAIHSMPPGSGGANLFLIAGGKDKNLDYHDAGPVLAPRVKQAFLLGECREKLRGAWSLFTPCALADSLEEAVFKAAGNALPGDVVLLSPACSSFDMFRNYQHRGEVFCQAVESWRCNIRSSSGGEPLLFSGEAGSSNRISSLGADGVPRSSSQEPLTEKLNQRPCHE